MRETGGNALYVREIVEHLVGRGVLPRSGAAPAVALADLGVPIGVQQVVYHRLSGLSPNTISVLRLASAFTGGVAFSTLLALSKLDEETLFDAIDEAVSAGLLRAVPGRIPRYVFAHAIARHAIYDEMNPDRRARLHRRIADALEQRQAVPSFLDLAELAWQYHASVALPGAMRGIPHALEAAEQARRLQGVDRAVTYLRIARDLEASSPPGDPTPNEDAASSRADILCRLAMAEAEAMLWDDSARSIRAATEWVCDVGGESSDCVAFLTNVALTMQNGGAPRETWVPLVERGLDLVEHNQGLAWARLSTLLPRQTAAPQADLELGRAIALMRSHGTEDDYARTIDPLVRRGIEETRQVYALSKRWSSPSAVMHALEVTMRDTFWHLGEYNLFRTSAQEMLDACRRHGAIAGQAEVYSAVGMLQLYEGDLPRAVESVKLALDLIQRLGAEHRLHTMALATRTMLSIYRGGDWGGAIGRDREPDAHAGGGAYAQPPRSDGLRGGLRGARWPSRSSALGH